MSINVIDPMNDPRSPGTERFQFWLWIHPSPRYYGARVYVTTGKAARGRMLFGALASELRKKVEVYAAPTGQIGGTVATHRLTRNGWQVLDRPVSLPGIIPKKRVRNSTNGRP